MNLHRRLSIILANNDDNANIVFAYQYNNDDHDDHDDDAND